MKSITLFFIILFVSCQTSKKASIKDEVNATILTKQSVTMDISMYPEPEANNIRHIIELVPLSNENKHQVEFYITKEMEVDCNQHLLRGDIKEKKLAGLENSYYIFETKSIVSSTKKRCPDNTLKKKNVKSISNKIAYNSKLPIVVYTPNDFNVKYNIWNAQNVQQKELMAIQQKSTKQQNTPDKDSITLQLKLSSKEPIILKNNTFSLTLYGYNQFLADHSATLIVNKKINIDNLPTTVSLQVPKNVISFIKPPINDPSMAKFYVSILCDCNNSGKKDSGDIINDYENGLGHINITEDTQTLMLKTKL